jgi:excinuclease ABC subunit C
MRHTPEQEAVLENLRARVAEAPTGPGIYRWLDAHGTVLYVGKAKVLRNRMRWYVTPQKGGIGPWRESFLRQIADFDVTVTGTEIEALILETNLIKELRPKYNVLMKDDKHYLYVRITLQDPYPRVETVRRMLDDKAKYFGPIASGEEVRRTLALLRKLYPFRTCKMEIVPAEADGSQGHAAQSQPPDTALSVEEPDPAYDLLDTKSLTKKKSPSIVLDVVCHHKDRPTPCLDYHIEQCVAPCIGTVTPAQYRERCIDGVVAFLKGDRDPAKKLLQERMRVAAVEKKFEQAARYRDMLMSVENVQEAQVVSDTTGEDTDIVGVAVLSGRAHVVTMQRRGGRLVNESHFALGGEAENASEVLEQFLPQYYQDENDLPDAILIPEDLPSRAALEEWLTGKKGRKVQVLIPERGRKSHLLQLAEKNAREKARQQEVRWESERKNLVSALEELQNALDLPAPPKRIEGYDISHLGGEQTVGSMVVMRDGKSANDHYRSFTIRTLKAGDVDDYKSLQEVLRRRLRYIKEDIPAEEKTWKKEGVTVGRARKAEEPSIAEIITRHPEELRTEPFDYADFLVGRIEDAFAGFVHLHSYGEKTHEVRCLWVEEEYRGGKLGHFLLRRALRSVKQGKVYVITHQELESYYAQIGFRYVLKTPGFLQERADMLKAEKPDREQIVMMYESRQNKTDPSLCAVPDLLVIDGGKGQLSSVMEILKDFDLQIPVIGLAKREEEVFLPGKSFPVIFPKDAQAKFLLMRLRDEAHRFANRQRESIGHRSAKMSALDSVPGIGEKTRMDLLKKFGSVTGIKEATDADVREIVSDAQLEALRKHL